MKLASITYQKQLRIGVLQGIDRCFVLDPERHGIPDNIEAFLASGQAQATLNAREGR